MLFLLFSALLGVSLGQMRVNHESRLVSQELLWETTTFAPFLCMMRQLMRYLNGFCVDTSFSIMSSLISLIQVGTSRSSQVLGPKYPQTVSMMIFSISSLGKDIYSSYYPDIKGITYLNINRYKSKGKMQYFLYQLIKLRRCRLINSVNEAISMIFAYYIIQTMNPSNAHCDLLNQHKRSNFSFDSQKPKDRFSLQREEYIRQPLLQWDKVVLLNCDKLMIGLANMSELSAGAIPITQNNSYLLAMLQIVPISTHHSIKEIQVGDRFYLQNVESNMFLSAQQQILKKFTSVCLARQCSPHCEFTFERANSQENNRVLFNKEVLKIRNVISGLYLHIEQENIDSNKGKHLWLSDITDQFKVLVLNRSKQHPEFLNNHDVVLLSYQISDRKYIGVAKRHNAYDVADRESTNLSVEVNKAYYSIDNCFVQFFSQDSGRSIPCLWRVVRNTFDHGFTFLIRSKQECVCLQHLQTGLFLELDSNNNFTLKKAESSIKIQNLSKFKTQFSMVNRFQPIYIHHQIGITFPVVEKKYSLQRVQDKNYVLLYFTEYLSFLQNVVKTMMNPRAINSSREHLVCQIKHYVFVYQELQDNMQEFADKGFYFFEFTLKILQLLKTILKDEKFDYHSSQFQLRKALLSPLIVQIIKFVSLIIIRNQTFIKITSQDHKKTKEIIQIIFVLYHFHFTYSLNLMVCLASTDPDLVVRLLCENIYKHHNFEQRVALIGAISQIIEQFRRINFDQKNLKAILQKQHRLITNDNCIYIVFQRKEHSIFDLLESLSKYDTHSNETSNSVSGEQRQRMKESKETFYFYYYLLSIIRIMFSNKSEQSSSQSQNSISKSQYSIRQASQHSIKDNKILGSLIAKLSQYYKSNNSIKGKIILWQLIYEFTSEIYHKEFISYSKLNFIVYDASTLQSCTPLANVLKVIPENTLQWIFPKDLIISMLQELSDSKWQQAYELNTKLKLLSNMVNYLIVVVITSSYDLQTLNKIQQFAIHLLRIYDRTSKVGMTKHFGKTQQQINQYSKKISFVIVEGPKIHLDSLMGKLSSLFQAILIQKKRLYIYPITQNRDLLFSFASFRKYYRELVIDKRIKSSIRSIQQLLQLNQQKLQVSGMVLSREELENSGQNKQENKHIKGVKLIQKIIEDLDCLGIIMQSFRLYGQDKYLKENMVASMTLKIMNIQGLLKAVFKNKIYYKYSDAFNLSSHLFQFIIENSFEQDLILPLLQSLEERVMANHNIFLLIKDNIEYFFNLLIDPATFKTSRIILRWIAKQIENMPYPIEIKHYQFLYTEIVKLVQVQVNINLLFLINVLKQIGLNHPAKEEMIYSKLISHPQVQSFLLGDCSSVRSFKAGSDKFLKDAHLFYLQYQTSLQSVTVFRICQTYPHLMSHLNNLLPYQQIRQIMQEQQQYFLSRPLLSYSISELNTEVEVEVINLYIISASEHLSQYKNYLRQLQSYRVRYSLLKDKEGKAQTYLCKSNSVAITQQRNMSADVSFNEKQFYWEYLYWIPFYNKGEGLLANLQEIIKLIMSKNCNNENIDDNLQQICKYLDQIQSKMPRTEEHKEFLRQVRNIINLVAINKTKKRFRGRKNSKNDQEFQQIYKVLSDNNLIKPFLTKLIPPLLKSSKFPNVGSKSQYTSNVELQINQIVPEYQSSIVQSQFISAKDKSKYSLITPDQNESRFLVQQHNFNVLLFMVKLKQVCEYKVRVYDKLLHILVQYFEKGGSLVMLQYYLKQQVTAHINLKVSYNQIEYQLQRQVVKSNLNTAFGQNNPQMSLGIDLVNMSKLEELIQNNQLQTLHITLKHILQKCKDQVWVDQTNDTHIHIQKLLFTTLRLINNPQYQAAQIIKCCQSFVSILIKQHSKSTIEYENQLYSILSLFIYQIINSNKYHQEYRLHHEFVMLFATVEFKYFKSFNKPLEEFIMRQITPKMPRQLYYFTLHQILKMNIDLANSQKKVSIHSFSLSLSFIAHQFSNMIRGNLLSQNMAFYENHKLIVSILDLLQLILTRSALPTNYNFPQPIVNSLIEYEHLIYQNIYNQSSISKYRLELYLSVTVQILSFFHTYTLIKSGRLDQSSLLRQRQLFTQDLHINSSEVYYYYQTHFSFCILKNADQVVIAQSFVKQRQLMTWKRDFHRMLQLQSDVNSKKERIFSYVVLAVEQQRSQPKYQNFCHRIQPLAIIASTIVLLLAILQRFVVQRPEETNPCYIVLIIANLAMLVFVIAERLFLIRKLGRLQIDEGGQNWYGFVLHNKMFIGFSIFLMVVNVYSLFTPNYFSFLFFIHVFHGSNLKSMATSGISFNIKLIASLGLISFAAQFIFCILIDSQPASTIPIYGVQTRYNINLMVMLLRMWSDQFLNKHSFYYFLVIFLSLTYVFMASVIFFFLKKAEKEEQCSRYCLLCEKHQYEHMIKQQNVSDYHIEYQHNLYRLIQAFKSILKKEEKLLSLQQCSIKKMILQKDKTIYK